MDNFTSKISQIISFYLTEIKNTWIFPRGGVSNLKNAVPEYLGWEKEIYFGKGTSKK